MISCLLLLNLLVLIIPLIIASNFPLKITKCAQIYQRKEFRDMSNEEWKIFKDALLSLQNTNQEDGKISVWDSLTKTHLEFMHFAHGKSRFFPWHRAYVLVLERKLREINPNISIPYWDWTYDWEAPLKSPIFSERRGFEVLLGDEKGDCRYPRAFRHPHCLRRVYDPDNFPVYYAPDDVRTVIEQVSNYDRFRSLIETLPHAIVHTTLGGDMASMSSPNDPIFWIHHSMVDYVWWMWQRLHHQGNHYSNNYDGDVKEILEPFGITIEDVLDTERLCYSYQPFTRNPELEPRHIENTIKDKSTRPHTKAILPVLHWSPSDCWLRMNGVDRGAFENTRRYFEDLLALRHVIV